MTAAYPLQWYTLDKGAPDDIAVPAWHGQDDCGARSVHGLMCTRLASHTGRHHAGGSVREGVSPIFKVWA